MNFGRMDKIWEGILDVELAADARIAAIKAAVQSKLIEFEKHIDFLLDHVRTVSCMVSVPGAARPIKKPLNEAHARQRLLRLAQAYFWRQEITPAADRAARFRELAQALGKARDLAELARQDHVGSDLFAAWFDGLPRDPRGQLVRDDDGSLRAVHFPDIDVAAIVASLDGFQTAALRAAKDVPTTQRGMAAALPPLFIRALADAFQELTLLEARSGRGPFYQLVIKFRTALDPSYKIIYESRDGCVDESMIDAIKLALGKRRRRKRRKQPTRQRRLIPYAGQRK